MRSRIHFRHFFWLVLALGVAWRLVRYFLQMPLWGDEASLALNLLDRDFSGLLSPLANAQVSPLLFLWFEKLVLFVLGSSELALRFLPLMAGLVALWVFLLLARQVVEPLPAAIAVGILAVSYYTVRHSVEVKPYSFDLLAAVVLQFFAASFIQRRNTIWLVCWSLTTPFAVLFSFPAVFVFGACAVSLFFVISMHRPASRTLLLWGAGCAMGVLAFGGMLFFVSSRQYEALQNPMTIYWKDSFPPSRWSNFLPWLVETHAGNMMAYPIGGKNWGSLLTLLLCLLGIAITLKKWPLSLQLLFVLPFVLTLIAAVMHRYPYGGSARIAQHMAPAICLWAGLGTVWIIKNPVNMRWQRKGVYAVFVGLALVAAAGIIFDLLRPSKTPGDARAREIVARWTDPARAVNVLLVWQPMNHISPTFQWYLRTSGREILWNAHEDKSWMTHHGSMAIVSFDRDILLPSQCGDFEVSDTWTEKILVGPRELGPERWQSVVISNP